MLSTGLNGLCMSKSKSRKGKSPQITEEYIVEPVTENIKVDIEKLKQEMENSTTTLDKAASKTHEEDHTSNKLEN